MKQNHNAQLCVGPSCFHWTALYGLGGKVRMLQAAENMGGKWLKVRVSACDLLTSSTDILHFALLPHCSSHISRLFVCLLYFVIAEMWLL